jgi:hypothetical protein
MHTLRSWEAKRAGGRITINGKDATTGNAVKIVGVNAIEPVDGRIIATDVRGEEHELLVA